MGKLTHLMTERRYKVPIVQKNAPNKNYIKLNFLQKLCGRISLSPPGVELGGTKDLIFLK